ncbi:MAG: sigma-54-dependent Fis family transcriptional regulator, partial [Proteobacteria bacterium]|nr:sigma-54-dependent Fis family transcriptional regulator [Pseudomonadota bacterium]
RTRLLAADLSNLVEGGQWGEQTAGTNGIGTALARKEPVHVYASEHFCEGWHRWTCAGAPVLDPFFGKVLGVVDFTTLESEFRDSALGLSFSLANSISGEIRVQVELERVQLLHQYLLYAARFPGDGVLVFDRMGNFVRGSEGVEPSEHGPGGHAALPAKEVRQILAPGGDTPIGSLLVVPRPRRKQYSLATSGGRGEGDGRAAVHYGTFVTRHEPFQRVMAKIERVIPTDLSVLLTGETGTGKELIAGYIHNHSHRQSGPFVAVNCGAISKELFESKFFGYERGAFTGADTRGRKGLFAIAEGGTLFLDEVGEMPPDIQAGLLRVLEAGTYRRVGSDREYKANCRIVAATNRPLRECVEQGTFRSDLYYRMGVATVTIPPLRERPEDIPLLIDHIMRDFCARHGMAPKPFSPEAMHLLTEYAWPGNGREVRNVVESAVLCAGDEVSPEDIPHDLLVEHADRDAPPAPERLANVLAPPGGENLSVRDNERKLILTALHKYKKVSLVAAALGVSRSTLYRRFEALGLDHKEFSGRTRRPT